MPSRVGHITKLYEDGHCKARNELTGEEWFGRLVIGSGGMLMFDIVDERNLTVGAHIIEPENKQPDTNISGEDPDADRVTLPRRRKVPEPVE